MKYTVTKSFIRVIGKIWMPPVTCAMEYPIYSYELDNMRDDETNITKESIEYWLSSHSGDFQSIEDFYADIEAPEGNIIVNWAKEDSENTYNDCMYGN